MLIDNYNSIFDKERAVHFKTKHTIEEPGNKGTKHFQKIQFTGFDGFAFPHDLAKGLSSFAKIAISHTTILTLDCDGILLFELDNKKYLVFVELKSSYSSEDIDRARRQLLGSYLKFVGMMGAVRGWEASSYKVLGVIVSFSPTQEQINALAKGLEDERKSFAFHLQNKKCYAQNEENLKSMFPCLNLKEFEYRYVSVPSGQISLSIPIRKVL